MDISSLFPTLLSKTFLILALSLTLTYIGARLVVNFFRKALEERKPFVKGVKSKISNNVDIEVDPEFNKKLFWPSLIINIIAFIGMLVTRHDPSVSLVFMAIFTFTDGITLGLALINNDENLALKVTGITVMTTFAAAMVGMYSGLDFSFLGKFLFFGLLGLIIINIFRLFVQIEGTKRKIIATLGIIIFVGYLLYDFNNLHKANKLLEFNNWVTAQDFAVNIYLDIINLFLDILDFLH